MTVTWLKRKYSADKMGASYKSKHNDGKRWTERPRRKVSDKEKLRLQALQPRVVLVLLPSGKKRFMREEK